MAKDLLLPGNIIGLHRKAVEKLSKSGNGDAALLYLCLAAGQTSGALPWGAERVEAARNVLIQLGLLRSDTPVAPQRPVKLADERPPEYTSEDIAQAMNNEKFKPLVPAMEHLLGKILSPSDLKILYMIYDFLGLPPEVILTLAGWCNEKAKKGRPRPHHHPAPDPPEAVKWEKAGITTLDAADAHLQQLEPPGQPGGPRSFSSSLARAAPPYPRSGTIWRAGSVWAFPTSCCSWPATGPSSTSRNLSGAI